MKYRYLILALCAIITIGLTSCNAPKADDAPSILKKEDVKVEEPAGGFSTKVNQLLKITVQCLVQDGVTYQWLLDGLQIAKTKDLEYMFDKAGQYNLSLRVSQGDLSFEFTFALKVELEQITPPVEGATAYITRILDFMPAVGQATNTAPKYVEGDTQLSINDKVLAAIGNNKRSMISLGGFGGYVVVGFDHTIENVAGKRDFRVIGNAFVSDADGGAPRGGSCEPGVIVVAYDANKNGVPDDNEWYEIQGSAHVDATAELWYAQAVTAGNDVKVHKDYQITYFRPDKEPESEEEMSTYIRWEDNQGNSGYRSKNIYYSQPYFPLWATGDKLTLSGTRLPQNAINEGSEWEPYYVLYEFMYGYADNSPNDGVESAIDIDWAINDKGQKVHLPGVDFIKIYTGVNQENGWLGECSTEISGVEDLHLLGVNIDTRP